MDTCVDTKKARRKHRAQSSDLRQGAPDEIRKSCARGETMTSIEYGGGSSIN